MTSFAALATSTASAATSYASGATLARDDFNRTVSAGLGSATLGGRYTVSGAPAKVNGQDAYLGPIRSGYSASATLRSVVATDSTTSLTFSLPARRKVGAGEYVNVEMRRKANGDSYRASVRVGPTGRLYIGFVQVRNHVERQLGRIVVTRRIASPGKIVHLEAYVRGSAPVVLYARTWGGGTTVPGWQVGYKDSSRTRVTGAGAVSIRALTSRTSPATTLRIASLVSKKLTQIGSPARPTNPVPSSEPPTSASTSASSSTSTSTSATTPVPPPPPPVGGNDARGSAPVGSSQYPVPSDAIFVSSTAGNDSAAGSLASPVRTVRAALARAGIGQTLVLRAGTYHEDLFVLQRTRVTIQSYPGEAVWFDGSVPVTNWSRKGSTWVATGWTAQFDHSASFLKGSDAGGFVNPAYPMAAYPDQLFVDGKQLAQVAASSTPGPGQFAVDYSARTLTIGTDPAGHAVRASDLAQAFVVAGRVTLRGIGVRRYATALSQIATVYLGGSLGGDAVENVVVSDNAGQGLSIASPNIVVDHVTAAANGMTGLHSNNGSGSVIENSLITGNNTEHFNPQPASGGIKITRANGFVIRNNDVVGNLAVNGIWTDVNVVGFDIIGNTVAGNGLYGILTELSDTGVVANNTVSGFTRGYTALDTGNVRVFNNAFFDNSVWDLGVSQDSRRNTEASKATSPWVCRNIVASNNLLLTTGGSFQFYALDKATHVPADTMNITVDGNEFGLATSGRQAVMVGWGGSDNVKVTYYRNPAALNAGLNKNWNNSLRPLATATVRSSAVTGSDDSIAVPLPADIAQKVGVAAGIKHVGTF
ncbi:MAG: hypothetical protein JWR06_827 [Jatrophihabitans sp.]|nr:hypothetical protein [Jatrophihabitans sp.]